MIQNSFEKKFYIPTGIVLYNILGELLNSMCFIQIDPALDQEYNVNTKLVARRGIYKDVLGSSLEYMDYQLRPNFCVAAVVVK